ncbi:MAG: hypothetical protein MI919_08685, partial [Holophagales bacterium]|nr:hypothetical protein [Holophagales bacterium]
MALSGHYWTVWSLWRNRRRAGVPPAWSPWRASVEDPWLGQVPLTGKLAAAARGEREAAAHGGALIVLVHGLGGCSDSLYLLRAARVCHRLGLSSLRLDLRGSDREGHDIYHAGLSSDLAVALASEDLRPFGEIYLLGFSVGGHVVLRFATEVDDPRVKAVSAVCSPLDLAATVDHFDQPHRL